LSSQQTNPARNDPSLPVSNPSTVIRFRLRGSVFWRESGLRGEASTDESLVPSVEKYEYPHENDTNYRHRMLVNALAAVVTAFLIVTGVWAMSTLLETTQDTHHCLSRSISGCAAYYVPSR
jgi:hypothetical protein